MIIDTELNYVRKLESLINIQSRVTFMHDEDQSRRENVLSELAKHAPRYYFSISFSHESGSSIFRIPALRPPRPFDYPARVYAHRHALPRDSR